MRRLATIASIFVVALSCTNPTKDTGAYIAQPKMAVPADNPITAENVALGRYLFYEKGLSQDSSLSCASCHIQRYAFSDTTPVSLGIHGQMGLRNATTLTNVGYAQAFFKEGGVHTLERAVHPPLLTDFEMNADAALIEARLKQNTQYRKWFKAAFGTEPTYKGVVFALAAFQRTMVSFNAPYDAFMQGDSTAISRSAKRGLKLFRSARLQCSTCHKEPFFWDENFHNIGLYTTYADYGRGRFTLDSADFGKMKTPTLRNIAVTWPYMHDGKMKTLNEVLAFYQTGGAYHPNKATEIQPFVLSVQEREDLLSFLESLTDSTFLTSEALASPF